MLFAGVRPSPMTALNDIIGYWVRLSMAWTMDMLWHGMAWHGWLGMVWLAWYCLSWHGLAYSGFDMVWKEMV